MENIENFHNYVSFLEISALDNYFGTEYSFLLGIVKSFTFHDTSKGKNMALTFQDTLRVSPVAYSGKYGSRF